MPASDSEEVAARVLALYGKPRLETWEKIGRRLRLSRGSAWSWAHGLRKSDERSLHCLECVEWGVEHLEQAAENLRLLLNGGNDERARG